MNRVLKDLEYNKDGYFVWKTQKAKCIKVGQRAGSIKERGVEKIQIEGKFYSTHQLVFLLHNGYIPKEIDHIDANPSNNRISNLRECSKKENCRNKPLRTDNKSGYKGVFKRSNGRYTVTVDRKYFGTYDTAEEANLVAMKKREELHAEFCRHK